MHLSAQKPCMRAGRAYLACVRPWVLIPAHMHTHKQTNPIAKQMRKAIRLKQLRAAQSKRCMVFRLVSGV